MFLGLFVPSEATYPAFAAVMAMREPGVLVYTLCGVCASHPLVYDKIEANFLKVAAGRN